MPINLQYKKSDFEIAIKDSRGNKTLIARRVGCDRHTLYAWLKREPELADLILQAKHSANNELMDIARLKLRTALLAGQPYAVSLVLRTLGRSEGFTERQEVTGADGEPFSLTVIIGTTDKPLVEGKLSTD